MTGTPEAVAAEIKALNDTFKTQLAENQRELSTKVAELKASSDTLLKEEIAKINADTATKHEAFTKRLDELDVKMQEAALSGGSTPDAFGDFLKSFQGSELAQTGRGKVRHSFAFKAITNLGESAGGLLVPQVRPDIVAPGEAMLTVLDLVPKIPTTAASIRYMRELLATNNAGYQGAQGTKKPESAITFEDATANVETLAHFIKASKQILADAPGLRAYVESRMRYLLRYKASGEILAGDGASNHLSGINTQATAYDDSNESSVDAPTRIDRLRLGMEQVSESEFPATAFVLSNLDWALIQLAKTTEGAYLFVNPTSTGGDRLWGLPVATDRQQAAGTWTTGNFTPAAIHLWVREEASVVLSSENEDDFVKNLVTILAEMRAALTVYRPSAFVTGDFTFA